MKWENKTGNCLLGPSPTASFPRGKGDGEARGGDSCRCAFFFTLNEQIKLLCFRCTLSNLKSRIPVELFRGNHEQLTLLVIFRQRCTFHGFIRTQSWVCFVLLRVSVIICSDLGSCVTLWRYSSTHYRCNDPPGESHARERLNPCYCSVSHPDLVQA